MKAMFKFLAPSCSIFLLLQTACVDKAVTYAPEQTLLLPENHKGLGHGRAGFAVVEQSKITLADKLDTATPETDKPRLNHDAFLSGIVELNLIPRIDALCTGVSCGAKWQILGDAVGEAEEGNVSLALAIVHGKTRSSQEGDSLLNQTTKVKVDGSWTNSSVLAGYRLQKTLLLYGGLGYNYLKASGSAQTNVGSAAEVDYSLDERKGQSTRIISGLHYSPGGVFYVQVEPAYIMTRFEDARSFDRLGLSGTLGWQW